MRTLSRAMILALVLLVSSASQSYSQVWSWEQTNGPWGGISTIAATDSMLFSRAGYFGGLYQSSNEGRVWQPIGSELEWTHRIIYTGSCPRAVFVVASFGTVDFPSDTVYRSTDNGTTWTALDLHLHYGNGLSLHRVTFTSRGSIVFAIGDTGIFRSTDNGDSWVPIHVREYDSMRTDGVTSLALTGSMIYAGTMYHGVYQSSNLGDTWYQDTNSWNMWDIEWLAASGGTVLAATHDQSDRLYRSRDTGKTWEEISFGDGITSLISRNGKFFIGSTDGVYRSDDSGTTWRQLGSSFSKLNVTSLAQDSKYLFAIAADAYVHRTSDDGATWAIADTGVGPIAGPIAANGSGIYLAGLWRTTDFGDTWLTTSTTSPYLNPIASTSHSIFGSGWPGVYSSTDNGASWDLSYLPDGYFISEIAGTDSALYALAFGTLFRLRSGESDWAMIDTPQHWGAGLAATESAVFVSAYNYGDHRTTGIYRSIDLGDNWTRLDTSYQFLAPIVADGRTVCAPVIRPYASSGYVDSVFLAISFDNGNSWRIIHADSSQSAIRTLAIKGNVICIGLISGILCSTNAGVTWTKISDLWANYLNIYGNYVFANGVLRAAIPPNSGVRARNTKDLDISIFPNPSSLLAALDYTLSKSSTVTLTVFDALGRELALPLANGWQEAGNYEITIDGERLAAGVYTARLALDGEVRTARFVVQR